MKKSSLVVWSFLCAVAVLLFTTRSSILFICNNWDDANSYFTMGKGMMNGLVIYRDLYDQKGPFLYLLYGIAYLISKKTFLGVFIFEILAATVFLFYAGKFIHRKTNGYIAFALVPILSAAVYSSWSFYFGGAAEEFCLPLLAISLFHLDELLHDEMTEERLEYIFAITGLCAGIIGQIKYTMLGFFLSWFLIALVWIGKKKGAGFAAKVAVDFIIFAIIPSILWFIYFLATGSMDDWFRCYIYNNLFHYSQVSSGDYSFFNKLYEMTKTLYWLIRDSFSYFVWIIVGMAFQIVTEKGVLRKIAGIFMFGCTYFVIFIGGNKLAYYSIPLMVFAIPGVAYFGKSVKELSLKYKKEIPKAFALAACAAVLFESVLFAADNTVNAEYRKFKKEDMWLVEAAKILDENDTLLEINAIDAGLYTATGIKPSCEYFQTNGINLDKMFEEQKRYLKEKKTDYVLAVNYEPEKIYDNYSLFKVFEYNESEHEETYYLYKKNQ
ncbi:MAG: hypothetical protein J5802_01400 [Butyrivibrio sp.]|nr:hypothetical protein [Butyrivibrio sp.]